ncbi:TPA: transposase [Staphylococcus aureus]|nr:transposase [Staphylococcus aureus]
MTSVRRTFSKELKLKIVELYEKGMTRIEIIREYDLTLSIFSN